MTRALGGVPLPWQDYVSNVIGEVEPDGRMTYPVVVLLVPRRGGKTYLTLPTCIQRVSIAAGSRAWYTAQTGGDASTQLREEWIPLVQASTSPHLAAARARLSNGSEGVWLPGRRSLRMFAPTRKAMHGKDADVVVVDEVWAHTLERGEEIDAAIRPTMLTRPRRQVIYISAGGTDESTWLLALRERGRRITEAGRNREAGLAYFEWHPPVDPEDDTRVHPDVDLDDPALWAVTHPAIGYTAPLSVLEQDRASMGDALFYRSYLNVFQSSDRPRVLPRLSWERCREPDLVLDGDLVLAYDVNEDRTHGSIVAVDPDGAAELIDYRPGSEWMPDRLVELRRRHGGRLAAAGAGPPSTVTADLLDAGEDVIRLSPADLVTACAGLLDDVLAERLRVRPDATLDRSAAIVARRYVDDGWVWTRRQSTGDAGPVVALTVGRHVARHTSSTVGETWFPDDLEHDTEWDTTY